MPTGMLILVEEEMIDRNEIEQKAKKFEIHVSNVERDYVFGWLLFGIFSVSSLKDEIFLKGGNALRKGYFKNTRYSSDLDFGIPEDINCDLLLSELNKVCDFVQEKSGVTFIKEDNKIEEKFTATETPIPGLKVYEAKLYFKDFYGNSDHCRIKISMDITRFDKVLLPIQLVNLIHPYSDETEIECKIRCMKLEEIVATKLKCLLQRQHAPDLFDYAYSINLIGGTLDRDEVVHTFIQKTIFSQNPVVVKEILSKTPFEYFQSCWEKSVICAKHFLMTVNEAINIFLLDLEGLFNSYSDNSISGFVFFGPDLRTPIMKAGREQTLLRITYNNSARLVEPYSLKYKEKRNGQAREYFYVYNKSGGSNQPGVRSLVPEGFSSIANTEEKFEPRYQIELSKSGELPEDRYLFDPNRPVKAPRRSLSSRRFISRKTYRGPIYSYQCSYCGKKFSKRKMNSTLGMHKDKNGYRCSGRYGIYLDTKY